MPCDNRGAVQKLMLFEFSLSVSETVAAKHGAISPGLKGNLAGFAAFGANRVEHLALTAIVAGIVLACVTAGLAALGFVSEASLGVKLLLTGSESEFLSAIFADKGLVLEHLSTSLKNNAAVQIRIAM